MKQSVRTKNRLREHKDCGGLVEIRRTDKIPSMNCEVICFRCPCGWIGWLPANEMES